MRIFTLIATFIWAAAGLLRAQCDLSALQPLNSPNQVLLADEECTDAQGWTHYYNTTTNRLLLSIKKNGQDIGSIDLGMSVRVGTLPEFGSGNATNLSTADYIDNSIWIVTNRYWQVAGANAISAPVQVRFYFSNTDVSDIAASVDDFGFLVDEPKDLYMYTISGAGGLYPLSTSTQPFNAVYTLYDMFMGGPPEWADGTLNGHPYGEFSVNTLDNGGGAGFLIFQNSPPLTISGKISKKSPNPSPVPVSNVTVRAAAISTDVTDINGNYSCPSLLSGSTYEVIPTKDDGHDEDVSIIDVVCTYEAALAGTANLSPYQIIAANVNNNNNVIDFLDVMALRNLLLGNVNSFPNNTSWRFVPETYAFPNPANPFMPPFPERIVANNLQDSLLDQNFVGIKIGDVCQHNGNIAPNNTVFSLPNLNACNPGDTVSFDLTVQDFQGIRGFGFTLEWDANVMQYVGASDFHLTSLNNNAIGSSRASEGKLGFAWFDQQGSGATVANGTSICKLKFVATGNVGTSTPLAFTSSIVDKRIVQIAAMGAELDLNGVAGSFIIDNNTTVDASAFVQTTSCAGPATGAIDLTATGGTQPLHYVWINGATSQDLFGLTAGSYTVTISDASSNCPLVLSYEVTTPAAMNIGGTVQDMSCPYVVDGSIELHIAGGEAPFSYQWSNGYTGRFNDNLYEGTYSVTITDGAGCTSTASFDIENAPTLMPVVMVTNASNANKSDGSLMMTSINGGVGPFSFLWNNGATTQSLMNLPPGDYVVTITDGVGCQHVFGYEVYGLFTATVEVDSNLANVSARPNPVQAGAIFDLVFDMKIAGKITATTVAADGRVVNRQQFALPVGTSMRPVQAPLAKGFYITHFEMDGQAVGRLKLLVQ